MISKIIKFIKTVLSGEDYSNYEFSSNELIEIKAIRTQFCFLSCFEDNSIKYDKSVAFDILNNNKIPGEYIVEGSKKYIELLNDKECKKQLFETGYCERPFTSSVYDFVLFDEYFELQDGIVKHGLIAKPNTKRNACIILDGKEDLAIKIKFNYDEDFVKHFNHRTWGIKDDVLCVDALNFPTKSGNEKLVKNGNYVIPFVVPKGESQWVFKDFYDKGTYQTHCNMQKYQTGICVVDKQGEVVDNKKLDAVNMLNQIRHANAHFERTNYNIDKNRYYGQIIFVEQNNEKFAVLINDLFFYRLSVLNAIRLNQTKSEFTVSYIPRSENGIKNSEELTNVLNNSKIINIKFVNKIEDEKLKLYIETIMENYHNISSKIKPDIKEFLKKHISKKFLIEDVEVEDFENITMLSSILNNNNVFFDKKLHNSNKKYEQENFIAFLINEFYGAEIVSSDVVDRFGNVKILTPNTDCFIHLTDKFLDYIYQIYSRDNYVEKHKKKIDKQFLYSGEIYLTLCAFSGYANLVYNGLFENVEKFHNGYLKSFYYDEEKYPEYKVLKNLQYTNMFEIKTQKEFKVADSKSVDDSYLILRGIRNAICHGGLKVRFDKSGKFNKTMLVFTYKNTPNTIVRVTAENFLKFIDQPILKNYKNKKEVTIEVENFDDLLKSVVKIINKK